jgi:hypothetical protein
MSIQEKAFGALFAAALAVAPIAAQASVVAVDWTMNPASYDEITVSESAALPEFGYWIIEAETRAGNLSGTYRSPFDETENINSFSTTSGATTATEYFAVGPANQPNPAILGFTRVMQDFSLLWGSPDAHNTLTFRLGDAVVGTFAGNAFGTPLAFGSRFVLFEGKYDSVTFSSTSNAFEWSNMSASPIPLPAAGWLLLGGLGALGAAAARRRKAADV